MAKTDLQIMIEEEAEKVRNTAVPIKAGLLERLLVRKASVKRLHRNPEDEFTFPTIGPSMEIISSYVAKFKENRAKGLPLMDEPLYVQKMRPSGYLLLNGHHRWAAAIRLGIKTVPISIVNGVFEADIKAILEASKHEKRATLDLDEVVFADPAEGNVEKRHGLPVFGLQKKWLRSGIPALIKNLKLRGYDVWVYAADYYSIDDIRRYFKHYGVSVDGIITGMNKRSTKTGKGVEELFANRYSRTLHIDRDMLLLTRGRSGDFTEVKINCEPQGWAGAVTEAVDRAEGNEG